ncbi:DUF1839 family protein [Williamsia sterculiae]|uniref:DUF1839 family protein n=1 Tax=Williamsia sterculiae TaxID=1344003 RepID=A0A1N7CIG5_9NOCA|nr:DUF1839 family protein [Williamsia sterculiae]SIR63365.1 protein of unknown function [Williamsia sterculiae]
MTTAGANAVERRLVDIAEYTAHVSHTDDNRIWRETNCYVDVWIETLNLLGLDPVPSFAGALAADHDGQQWTFIKPDPADLRVLYGLEVAEDALWRPVLETVQSGPARNMLHTVEVDSWWLPDTAGTDYRSGHVKTTIVPLRVDSDAQTMTYLHNSGMYRLEGDDFVGIFGLNNPPAEVLPPYVEQIRWFPERARPELVVDAVRGHLARRPAANPVERLAESVREATIWLPGAGMETFHRWAFATLRQCGSTAELAADLVSWLDDAGVTGAAEARQPFLDFAADAKAVQFKMARAARGRTVDVDSTTEAMVKSWDRAIDIVIAAVA